MSLQEVQIAHLLRVAKEEISFCKYIISYPRSKNKKNYDPSSKVDRFYKNTANAFFGDVLLIITTLLDKDKRVLSMWNLQVLAHLKNSDLQNLADELKDKGFITIRDQMIAHVDSSNKSNTFPDSRRLGLIREDLVLSLELILSEAIELFIEPQIK